MNHASLIRAAERFWATIGGRPDTVPADVTEGILFGQFGSIEQVPGLSIARLDAWLSRRGIPLAIGGRNRRLRGCALAFEGTGMLFLDHDDPPAERRFTLAHELGHLLLDYYGPRERNAGLIGVRAESIFDGAVDPTPGERLAAALSGEELTPFIHLMTRDRDAMPPADIAARESRADRLACELLAPIEDVSARLWPGWTNDEALRLLIDDYGLPAGAADDYLHLLIGRFRPAETFVDWLAPSARSTSNILPFTPRAT